MENTVIGKITRVKLRDVWKHEAYDFTKWVQENIDVLNNLIEINLSNPEREQNAGSFSVDIIAEDDAGNPVIIENQLEKSDHEHLGKLITYLVSIGAKTAIWIVSEPRPEHINAINWLNESSASNFFLLKVEAVRIGDSVPAPLLTVIVGPSLEGKEAGKTKKEISERHSLREVFWTQLLEYAKTKTKLHAITSTSQYNWIGTSSGVRGLNYKYSIRKDGGTVELYIDRGEGNEEINLHIFNQLLGNKGEIESTFGERLDWQSMEGKRACRIASHSTVGGYRDQDQLEAIIHDMVDKMVRLEKAFKNYLKNIELSIADTPAL